MCSPQNLRLAPTYPRRRCLKGRCTAHHHCPSGQARECTTDTLRGRRGVDYFCRGPAGIEPTSPERGSGCLTLEGFNQL